MTVRPSFFEPLGRDLVEKRRRLVRRRRARRIAGAVVAVIALTGAAVAFTLDRDGGSRSVVAEPGAIAAPSEWSWRDVPKFPLPVVGEDPILQWVGSKIFAWSTEGAFLHDPGDGTTAAVPPAPVEYTPGLTSVWTGSEVVMVGRGWNLPPSAEAVAFDPAATRWRLLPATPLEWTAPLVTVWTGREALFWGDRGDRTAASEREGAAYNPATNTWRRLADAPIGLNSGNGVWTGTELIVIGGDLDQNGATRTPTQMLRYDPIADEWTVGPPPPVWPQSSHAVWNGDLVVWDYDLTAVRYDGAANVWRPLPPAPLDSGECGVGGTTVGAFAVMVYCGQYAALDLRSETWTVLRETWDFGGAVVAPDHILHVGPTGNELLVVHSRT